MSIGVIWHTIAAVGNLCMGNLPGAALEGAAAVRSYAISEALSPVTDAIKEKVGDMCEGTEWTDVLQAYPL